MSYAGARFGVGNQWIHLSIQIGGPYPSDCDGGGQGLSQHVNFTAALDSQIVYLPTVFLCKYYKDDLPLQQFLRHSLPAAE